YMPAMFLQLRDRGQRAQGLLGELWQGQVSEFACHLSRIEQKSDVGWRHSCRDGRWLLLNVVRDQPIVFGRAEFREIAPDMQSGATKKNHLFTGRLIAGCWGSRVKPQGRRLAKSP